MIAVDWGTSRLRLYRLDEAGDVRETRRSDRGVLACNGDFRQVLEDGIRDWDDPLVLMCGMIGGRGGWREVPYLDCPIDAAGLARGLQPLPPDALPGREAWIVPGLRDADAGHVPDLMRGEETQLAALLDALPTGTHHACLPGTHSKWVLLREGRIARITTAMTGELYALLRRHSILGRLMPAGEDAFDVRAFDAGLERSAQPGGLLHHLFGVRTTALFGQQAGEGLPAYLSGLLVGHELRESAPFASGVPASPVHLVGNDRLLAAYAHALARLGIAVECHPEELAARGLHGLWRHRAAAA